MSGRIERSFLQRVAALPDATRRMLLVAAAEPVGDVDLLWQAAEHLGLSPQAAAPALMAGLVDIGVRVRFRHPLVRSAAYRAASAEERRGAHRALAEATNPDVDPDRRAWHRAHGAADPDETLAGDLERSADRAQARGGVAAAAAFLARATELTPDPSSRARRALDTAQAKFDAGAPDAALEFLAIVEGVPLDRLQRARVERLRAEVAFARRRGRDAPPLLLAAARRLGPLDAAVARETYLEALGAAIFAGRLDAGRGMRAAAAQAREEAPPAPYPPRAADLLLDGLTSRYVDGFEASVPRLRRALATFQRSDAAAHANRRWLWLACPSASEVWDDDAWQRLTVVGVRLAREAGALNELPVVLTYRAAIHALAGEFAAAAALNEETVAISLAAGNAPIRYSAMLLAAWRGDHAPALAAIDDAVRDALRRGEGRAIGLAEYAKAVLYNGLARYEDALAATERANMHDDLGIAGWWDSEAVEAAVRCGAPEKAGAAVERLAARTSVCGTNWALGIEARARALVSEAGDADALYREAIARLARTRVVVHLARAHLLYGEWLRREQRRADAREHLRAAHESFQRIGAVAFGERAGRELVATGETLRQRTADHRERLTPQEAQIARMAARRQTNPEIAAQLFISPRTVEYHLRKVFTKLGINSRRELRSALPSDATAAAEP